MEKLRPVPPARREASSRQKDSHGKATLGTDESPGEPPTTQEPKQMIGHSLFKKGEMVTAKLPHVRKGQPPHSKPLAVTQVLGFFNYILDDGKKHNARHLKPWKQDDSSSTQEDTPATRPRPQEPRRSRHRSKGRMPQRFDPCRDEAAGRN
ncbi:MAG: hypothetical protein GY696_33080 [Gammaproteobacteria bacterium]|nr:hypothetical protein [Gammaproteobacteria bacterium]